MTSLKTKITTPLVEETQAFFERVFGMSIVEEWDSPGDRGVILQFDGGSREALLEIYQGESNGFGGLSLQFKVSDVDVFVESLDGQPFEGPTDRPWGSRYVYMSDPNGIAVVVYDGSW